MQSDEEFVKEHYKDSVLVVESPRFRLVNGSPVSGGYVVLSSLDFMHTAAEPTRLSQPCASVLLAWKSAADAIRTQQGD